MHKILLSVDYVDETGKYWQDSYIKNKVVRQEDGENIHQLIARSLKEIDGVIISHNGKHQGNVYRDKEDGSEEIVGYLYRVRTEIYNDRNEPKKALFTAWVTISEVIPCTEVVNIED